MAYCYYKSKDLEKGKYFFDQGVRVFDKENKADLKIREGLTDDNLNHIRKVIDLYDRMTEKIKLLVKDAKTHKRDDILAELKKASAIN